MNCIQYILFYFHIPVSLDGSNGRKEKKKQKKNTCSIKNSPFLSLNMTLLARTMFIDTLDRKSLVGKWCIRAVLIVLPSMHLWCLWQLYSRWCQREGGRYGCLLATEDRSACDVSAQCFMITGCESRLIGFRCRMEKKTHRSSVLNIIIEHMFPADAYIHPLVTSFLITLHLMLWV